MKMFISTKKTVKILSLTVLSACILFPSSSALAKHRKHHHPAPQVIVAYKDEVPAPAPIYSFLGKWYVGGNIGESRTHDKKAAGTSDSVTQIGPGWSVDLGYQIVQFYRAILSGELGYTQYHNSNETTPAANVASTEHFATYLAAVAQYPIVYNFNVLGKLGVAYSYAKKVFTATSASKSANTYSLYYGLGVSYNVTSNAAFVLQWARARGNHSTGSTDLTSLGISYNLT